MDTGLLGWTGNCGRSPPRPMRNQITTRARPPPFTNCSADSHPHCHSPVPAIPVVGPPPCFGPMHGTDAQFHATGLRRPCHCEDIPMLSSSVLEKLTTFDTPTICNIIELFDVRPRNTGYMDARIKAAFPEMGPIVGFAATPPPSGPTASRNRKTATAATMNRSSCSKPCPDRPSWSFRTWTIRRWRPRSAR